MNPGDYAIVGASESDEIGTVPDTTSMGLLLNAAANALAEAGLTAADIDGITTGYFEVADVSRQLGIFPKWADNTVVGGCSWMFQLRNAIAAIEAGYCETVLITYGESGKSTRRLGQTGGGGKGSMGQQFDMLYAGGAPPALFGLPIVRYMREYGMTEEQLASVAVAQREWATMNPRATLREATTVDEVLESPMIAWPLRRAMCCLVSDAGGAIVVTSADRAKDFPKPPVYVLGSGGALEAGIMSPAGVREPLRPEFIRTSGEAAFNAAGITHWRRRPSDDLRRLRPQPDLRAGGTGVRRVWRSCVVHRRWKHPARWRPAHEHQRRRHELRPHRRLRHVVHVGVDPPGPGRGIRPGRRRRCRRLPRLGRILVGVRHSGFRVRAAELTHTLNFARPSL